MAGLVVTIRILKICPIVIGACLHRLFCHEIIICVAPLIIDDSAHKIGLLCLVILSIGNLRGKRSLYLIGKPFCLAVSRRDPRAWIGIGHLDLGGVTIIQYKIKYIFTKLIIGRDRILQRNIDYHDVVLISLQYVLISQYILGMGILDHDLRRRYSVICRCNSLLATSNHVIHPELKIRVRFLRFLHCSARAYLPERRLLDIDHLLLDLQFYNDIAGSGADILHSPQGDH